MDVRFQRGVIVARSIWDRQKLGSIVGASEEHLRRSHVPAVGVSCLCEDVDLAD